jgi:hypothetical protein
MRYFYAGNMIAVKFLICKKQTKSLKRLSKVNVKNDNDVWYDDSMIVLKTLVQKWWLSTW